MHAEVIADHAVAMQPGDAVIIDANPAAEDLVVALQAEIGRRGATSIPISRRMNKRARRAYLQAADGDLAAPTHEQVLIEVADVHLGIRAARNVTQMSDVPPAAATAYQ
ncbi:MAG: leucyl aminopeptidase (aminopeptidase T) [halophilic archaeon J07HX5]|jgi:Leucyl aminopeptidase (aminopeptidase T)|nr:MAG: leucyl aminopeptidase (aminopeptidase T) [halophilic archaeon J07HX5]